MSNGSVNFTSLSDGTLSPDARVNYNFGLVLGVNEFRQEQKYFLEKHYLHNNELHGYGSVTGLKVSAALYPEEKPNDVQVTVHPGMAIDQLGRALIVREDQCARLGAWLAQQIKNDPDSLKKHPANEDGFLTVYIVASYDETPEQSVPVAGGLSSNGGGTSSRLRDSFKLEFRWDPPRMAAWGAVREFAAVLDRVHASAGVADEDKDEDEDDGSEDIIEDICERVRKIGKPDSAQKQHEGEKRRHRERERFAGEDAGKVWYVPEPVLQHALDRIFTAWTVEVRPRLAPNLVDAQAALDEQEAGILLARVAFQPADPFLVNKPVVVDFDEPENHHRPFLLSTQVLQELVAAGARDTQPPREFATLQTRSDRTLQVWIHHPAPIRFRRDRDDWNEMLELKCDGRRLNIADVAPVRLPDMRNVLDVSIGGEEGEPSGLIAPGSRVELTFKLHKFRIRDEGEDERGKKAEDSGLVGGVEDIGKGLEKAERDVDKGELIEGAEHVVGGALHGAEDVVEGVVKGVKDIGKGVVKGVEDVGKKLEKAGEEVLEGRLVKSAEDVVKGAAEGVEDVVEGAAKGVDAVLGVPEEEEDERHSLRGSIDDLDIDYVGHDRVENTITVYTIADHQPSRELVTLYLYNPQVAAVRQDHPAARLAEAVGAETALHLWFHTQEPVRLGESCRVLVPLSFTEPPQAATFAASAPPGQSYSYFWALVPPAGLSLQAGELLTVELDTDRILVAGGGRAEAGSYGGGGDVAGRAEVGNGGDKDGEDKTRGGEEGHERTLTDVIKDLPYRFAGYDGDHTIVAHHQVPFALPPIIEGGERDEGREREEGEREERQERQERREEREERRRPVMPFVTITYLPGQGEGDVTNSEAFELWFHLISDPNDEIASFNEGISCEVSAELSDLRRSGRVEITNTTALQLNVYMVSVSLPQAPANQQAYYLRFKFPLAANPVSIRRGQFYESLAQYAQSRGIDFEGFNGRDAIVAYVRVPARGTA